MPKTIESLRSTWAAIAGERPFEFEFMDEAIAQHYQAEDRFLKIFTTFSVLSIMLGGLGLFGLTAFMAKRRTKEIGIRRVMGASVSTLIRILSKDFLKLVLIANIIGWPIAWYFMNKWLEDFAYRIHISWWIFAAAALVAVIVALATISFQAIKAALMNPVNSLRTE